MIIDIPDDVLPGFLKKQDVRNNFTASKSHQLPISSHKMCVKELERADVFSELTCFTPVCVS